MEDVWGDEPLTSGDFGDWSSNPSSRHSRKLTEKETFKKLDELDIEYIETYLRKKKIKKIKKDLAI